MLVFSDMYAILIHYEKPLAEIEKQVAAHRAYLDKWYQAGALIASGPQNPKTGGMILARQMERSELEEIIRNDPYSLNHLASYQIIEFSPVKYAKEFEVFLTTFATTNA